jgi:hypothetical protein
MATLAEATSLHGLLDVRLCYESTVRPGVGTVAGRSPDTAGIWMKWAPNERRGRISLRSVPMPSQLVLVKRLYHPIEGSAPVPVSMPAKELGGTLYRDTLVTAQPVRLP